MVVFIKVGFYTCIAYSLIACEVKPRNLGKPTEPSSIGTENFPMTLVVTLLHRVTPLLDNKFLIISRYSQDIGYSENIPRTFPWYIQKNIPMDKFSWSCHLRYIFPWMISHDIAISSSWWLPIKCQRIFPFHWVSPLDEFLMDSVPGIENVAALLEEISRPELFWARDGIWAFPADQSIWDFCMVQFSDGFSWFILLDDSGRMVHDCNILGHIG